MKQGSFTQQVKDEICLGEYDENQLTALLLTLGKCAYLPPIPHKHIRTLKR